MFRFGSLRYLRLPAKVENWNEKTLNAQEGWLEIASPGGSFRPVQAVMGMHGHFYLVDGAQGRLCLYDTAAQLLSIFPLPTAILPATPGRTAVFRAADGAFTFMDYMTGEANQFADRQGSEGGTDWILRNRVKLPLGIRSCIQDAKASGIACAISDGPAHLDASLNRIESHLTSSNGKARLVWDGDAGEWVLEGYALDSERLLFRFWSAQRRLETDQNSSP